MTKTASIREIEHTIEALPQADQLKLLEKMVKHLKHSLLGNKAVAPAASPARVANTLQGALKQYANPALRATEGNAFAQAMKAKHANR